MITKIGTRYYDIKGQVNYTKDYELDDKNEYGSLPIAVAFPAKTQRRFCHTTLEKL